MKQRISSSKSKTTFNKIETAIDKGKTLASAVETVMDIQIIEQLNNDWLWVGIENTPKTPGWYNIDRVKERLIKITREKATRLQWHQRLFVYRSALLAVREKSNLALYIGGKYDDGRLCALYLCGPDILTRVAQK